MLRYRVAVGDRVRRLSNGEVVGTVILVDAEGEGFVILLDQPTAKQIDKNGGRQRVKSLTEANLEVCMSAQRDRADRGNPRGDLRSQGFGVAEGGVRPLDRVAARHRALAEDEGFAALLGEGLGEALKGLLK